MPLPPLTTIVIHPPPVNTNNDGISSAPHITNTALFGIDLTYFNLTPQFRGIKLVPPGLHFLHYGADDNSPREGIWIYTTGDNNNSKCVTSNPGSGDVIELKYNPKTERYDVTHEQIIIRDEDVWKSYAYMIKYPTTESTSKITSTAWQNLTRDISRKMLESAIPTGHVSSLASSAREKDILKRALLESAQLRAERNDTNLDEDALIAKLSLSDNPTTHSADNSIEGDELNFSNIAMGRQAVLEGAKGAELTQQMFDRSWYFFNILIQTEPKTILAEWRIAFLVMVIFGNFIAIEHWKAILELFLKSEYILTQEAHIQATNGDGIKKERHCDILTLYSDFIDTFTLQLTTAPSELITEIVTEEYFVRHVRHFTRALFANDYHSGFDSTLVDKSHSQTVKLLREKWSNKVIPVVQKVLRVDLTPTTKGQDNSDDSGEDYNSDENDHYD
ncbi:hypothetical protein NADFUDRAFT_48294 [Nadsonia fulvescens var. elongata DSM 6958]|uniref:AAR2-domain-containing protein n=1 Tax=Nadsonia fulvescens var. elongata DSM 6958 TaxID=857566 RepID=A0A1E3PCQ4_9ASCO|nr:hypothetical protein NADFUDRAFT_48294 [Nadsonia fulvescens var. elongata DSM 6958]